MRVFTTDRRRVLPVNAMLAVLVVALAVITFCFGSVRLSLGQVIDSLLGLEENRAVDFIVLELYLPQVEAALAVGLALGMAGTIFQQLLRNPLASPDFVGISSGASLAAVIAIASPGAAALGVPLVALVGGLVSALLMYLLAWRDGISGYRFILIGIGVSAFATGLTSYVLTRTDLKEARAAMHWLVGSIGQSGQREVHVLLAAAAVVLAGSALVHRMLRSLELGDEVARGLGTPVEPVRFVLILVGVALTALATAVAGPITFVALVAGPLANRLLGAAAGNIVTAALVGACLVLVSDFVAVEMLPYKLPTGVVTGAVGAPYLLWLLATTNRRGMGG